MADSPTKRLRIRPKIPYGQCFEEISKRPNRIRIIDFVGKCPDFYYLEKKWKLNKIESVKIHKKGKVVFDDQNKKYTIFVEVEAK